LPPNPFRTPATATSRSDSDHKSPHPGTPKQVLYHGFVKTREAKHDAALYRLYQQEAGRITQDGGQVNRVVLDFELKKSINRELVKLQGLPADEQLRRKQEIAQEHGLTVVDGKIPIPDLRLEYADRDLLRDGDERYHAETFQSAYRKWVSQGLSESDLETLIGPSQPNPQRSFHTYVLPEDYDIFYHQAETRYRTSSRTGCSTSRSISRSTACEC